MCCAFSWTGVERREFPRVGSDPDAKYRRPGLQWRHIKQLLLTTKVYTFKIGTTDRKIPLSPGSVKLLVSANIQLALVH
jgi:hypothetical protein